MAVKLAQCGIHSLQDLVFHLPHRYQDRTRITPIRDLRPGDWCVVEGRVSQVTVTPRPKKRLDIELHDQTGFIKIRFFNFHPQQLALFQREPILRAFGEVRLFSGRLELIHPDYQHIIPDQPCPVEETLTPIYATTQGLSQRKLRHIIQLATDTCASTLQALEWMTDTQLRQHKLLPMFDALTQLHHPSPDTCVRAFEQGTHPALKRLIMDELIAHQLSMQLARQQRAQRAAWSLPPAPERIAHFLSHVGFELTQAQQRVYQELCHDLSQNTPMMRLIQGDVGSGKTIVAAMAALQAIHHGYQVAMMVPTDILSEQHTLSMQRWFAPLNIPIHRLSGQMKAKQRRECLQALVDGTAPMVIGTHALFQNDVTFQRLGLVIIDEQHRFGVEQRWLLQQKGQKDQIIPHQLLMTATPIPRTLAMAQFAHLDLGVIDELPPGRTPVVTKVMHQNKRELIIERLEYALQQGRQAYWVCALIDESESIACIAATEHAQVLQAQLPQARIGLVHGRMKSSEKEAVMSAFKQGELQILVATTVIEVGVDVPNASLMIIDNAERLGLSQLHQLRGRVGRGRMESHCLLLYQTPLSPQGATRLQVMRTTNDGFVIANHDLALRGAGEQLGTRQTGECHFKIAELLRDEALLPLCQPIAAHLIQHNPTLAQILAARWLGDYTSFFQS